MGIDVEACCSIVEQSVIILCTYALYHILKPSSKFSLYNIIGITITAIIYLLLYAYTYTNTYFIGVRTSITITTTKVRVERDNRDLRYPRSAWRATRFRAAESQSINDAPLVIRPRPRARLSGGKPPVVAEGEGRIRRGCVRVCALYRGWCGGGTAMPVLYIILIRVLAADQLWRASGGAAPRVANTI